MANRVDVLSEMTGTLALRHVDDGAKVAVGETIAEIECMKTFWPLVAPVAGVVTFVVALGAVVGHDERIATVEVE